MTQKYAGSCHCGKVKFDVEASLEGAMECNCSICVRTGAKMVFVPDSAFKLHAGAEALTDYQFGKKSIHHRFCSTCGVRSFGDGQGPDGAKMFMINLRCLEGIDALNLQTKHHDGKSA